MSVLMLQIDRILIGKITVDSKADWKALQNMIYGVFKVSRPKSLRFRLF